MTGLQALRRRIDETDETLLEALAQRMRVIEEVLLEKESQNLPLFDAVRERKLLETAGRRAIDKGLDPGLVQRILREVINHARQVQVRRLQQRRNPEENVRPRVAYQGTDGAYSWLASRRHFAGELESVGLTSFADVIEAVENGSVELGFLPIENAIAGSIYEVYDRLGQSGLHVVGEEILKIEHCLIGLKTAEFDNIQTVLSHPVALQQCTTFLNNLKKATYRAYVDCAEAVKKIGDDRDLTQAAIASREAAELYNLKVLKEGIADHPENYTRFWVVSRRPAVVDLRLPSKLSLVLVTEHVKGALVNCLSALAAEGLNLTKIESHPLKGIPWQYQFYLDVEGNLNEERTVRALSNVRVKSQLLKVLGCYPQAQVHPAVASPPSSYRPIPRVSPIATITAEVGERASDLNRSADSEPNQTPPLGSRDRKSTPTTAWVGNVAVGAGEFIVMAGPREPVSQLQMMSAAALVADAGGHILRGGAASPSSRTDDPAASVGSRTSLLEEAGRAYCLPVCFEVGSSQELHSALHSVDLIEVGSGSIGNLSLLRELGRVGKPVLVRRGGGASIDDLLEAAEIILAEGNQQIILCESGIRTFETSTPATLDLSAVLIIKERSHLPVVVDPVAAVGKAVRVAPLVRAAKALGADGVLIQVQTPQGCGRADDQALEVDDFVELMDSLRGAEEVAAGL